MSILPYNSWNLSFGSVEEKMNREGSIRMIICKRSFYPVDHLQEVFLSCWSFAIDWSIQMIICKRSVVPDDHLQEVSCSWWSFARGWSILMINCKKLIHQNDHLQKLMVPSLTDNCNSTISNLTVRFTPVCLGNHGLDFSLE